MIDAFLTNSNNTALLRINTRDTTQKKRPSIIRRDPPYQDRDPGILKMLWTLIIHPNSTPNAWKRIAGKMIRILSNSILKTPSIEIPPWYYWNNIPDDVRRRIWVLLRSILSQHKIKRHVTRYRLYTWLTYRNWRARY